MIWFKGTHCPGTPWILNWLLVLMSHFRLMMWSGRLLPVWGSSCGQLVCYRPEVHDVVLMVSPVQVHVVGIEQQVSKQDEDHLSRLLPPVHEVPVEHVRRFGRRKAVLQQEVTSQFKNFQRQTCMDSLTPFCKLHFFIFLKNNRYLLNQYP